ncbi:VRR-NUC domain-containing protein [Burkholderia multivorans]|uniref:VRR-NUC domain-containing protein n=3 Tax=root TaxID=1 RepID=A0AAP2MQI6_9BURK|nr:MULTISPECIES: VRR-NUC domain-containing protein [Burkholderia cepacia complex]MBU9163112.1 VRR-NUC domain-containing protein [Burkholderia multivorans]MBU9283900.1 VRR-NUC domain-containing protein [Burkholderia multivorans]MBU9306038.1 VRR-NUC domain-containing protein [Burkholderia multivorans]MBU9358784.1 VRR-NUC domain-containing protein [Burkholderia multivorans]MBU9391580.1 VRR-NUC domain-containing protein [Burkholderia multivorans]
MTGYSGGSAAGNSTRDGKTTVVGARKGLTPADKAVLCPVMCKCNSMGVWTRGGGRLQRQRCVKERLDSENARSVKETGQKTPYVPEVSYDMTQDPPSPIMSDADPLVPHDNLLDYIRDSWPGKMAGYLKGKQAGKIQTRRPDVVVVNDPSQPPVQSNIRAVVEMKFDDDFGVGQEDAYRRIAGDDDKYAPLERGDCGCGDEKRERQTARSAKTHSETEELFGDAPGRSYRSPLGLPPAPGPAPSPFPIP